MQPKISASGSCLRANLLSRRATDLLEQPLGRQIRALGREVVLNMLRCCQEDSHTIWPGAPTTDALALVFRCVQFNWISLDAVGM